MSYKDLTLFCVSQYKFFISILLFLMLLIRRKIYDFFKINSYYFICCSILICISRSQCCRQQYIFVYVWIVYDKVKIDSTLSEQIKVYFKVKFDIQNCFIRKKKQINENSRL